jgi:hypothetical protein
VRIFHGFRRITSDAVAVSVQQVLSEARRVILEQEGLYHLAGTSDAPEDFANYYNTGPDDMFPTMLEALVIALVGADRAESEWGYHEPWVGQFTREVNEVLAQERVGWELIDGRMIEIHSKELHVAAVEPALRLLHRAGFAGADKAYRDALEELAAGKASDAITDAGTALQETLTALGCEGNQLGDLIRSAKKKGLLAPHDDPMTQAIDRLLNWVAADRSQMGDSHMATAPTREDAWLIVHVVGALIVRLASGAPRQ